MNKKLLVGIGIGIVVIAGVVAFIRQGNPQLGTQELLKKEIQVGTDVCAEFPKEWVSTVLKKPIVKTEEHSSTGLNVCQYYVDDNNFVTLRLNELGFENQKKGQETLGRTLTTNDAIPMTHFVAMQENNLINDIVLEITPNQFIAIDRSSTKAASETEIVTFAVGVAQRISQGENQEVGSAVNATSSPTKKTEGNTVPLPQDTDVVNTFLSLIGEGKASDAVMMMPSKITGDDSTKQAFGVQFSAMKSVKVKKMEASSQADWTDTWHQYMVTLDVVMDPSSANNPIPFYGYEKGENVRFITLVKEGNQWKIEGLATGP
jgi:hypothetical protein